MLGFVDGKTFPVLQQFVPEVGKYYNLRDKVIKSSSKGMDGKRHETSPQSDLNAHLSATHLQAVVELHPPLYESSSCAGMVFKTGASAKSSKAQCTSNSDCVWGQNL